MYPSCSNYGMKAFKERSFGSAMLLTADRLIRCGHDHTNYGITFNDKGYKLLDFPHYADVPDSLIIRNRNSFLASGDFSKDDEDTEFIKWLVNNKYFQEAILEVNRLFYQQDKFSAELLDNLMIALAAEDRLEEAIFVYSEYSDKYDLSQDFALTYRLAVIQMIAQNFKLSNAKAKQVEENFSDDIGLKARSLSLQSVNYAFQYDWEGVIKANEKLLGTGMLELQAKANMNVAIAIQSAKTKKPIVAGVLSAIVPGLGYAYSGHAQTGISALLVNGLLAYATYSSIRTENYGLAVLTGIFNFTFYLGNINGSAKSATRNNNRKKEDAALKIKNQSFL